MIDMKMSKWHHRFRLMAVSVGQWSKDPSTQVGAVVIGNDREVLSVGYNGFPRGMSDVAKLYEDKPFKHRHVIHAEENAILNAARNGVSLKGAVLYVTHPPCNHCAGVIVQAGITGVYYDRPDERFAAKYNIEDTAKVFWDCGVGFGEFDAEMGRVSLWSR